METLRPRSTRQFTSVLQTALLVKWRAPASLVAFFVQLCFMSFILIMLHFSLSQPLQLDPPTHQLPTLVSLCKNCTHIAITNTSNVDAFLDNLSKLLAQSEPAPPSIKLYPSLNSITTVQAQNYSILTALDLFNVNLSSFATTSYRILVNDSMFLSAQGSISSGYTTLLTYTNQALFNTFRSQISLPPFQSPLLYTTTNGVTYTTTTLRNDGTVLVYITSCYFIFMFFPSFTSILQSLAFDKQHLIKHSLVLIGLNQTIYIFASMLAECIALSPSLVLTTILFFAGRVITLSSWILFALMLVLFLPGLIAQSTAAGSFINSEKLVSGFGFLFFMVTLVLHGIGLLTAYANPVSEVVLMMLSPIVAMARGLDLIKQAELRDGVGITFDNAYERGLVKVFVVLVVDLIVWTVVAWYINMIFPGENLGGQRIWFAFDRAYWNPKLVINENEDSEERAIVKISNLTKEFKTPKKTKKKWFAKTEWETKIAVNDLSLELRTGECLALLGHNGAGKSTLINIIAGSLQPASGTVSINLKKTQLSPTNPSTLHLLRQQLGVCPQHDSLYANLTAYEQLKLCCYIKGVSVPDLDKYIKEQLTNIGLSKKTNQRIENLSGGQKRKLSVAMSLIGTPRIVVLDEPTTGMDVESQRTVWEIVQLLKRDKVVLVTTHSMEEADTLGDRVIVLSNGKIQVDGTPMELKERYGKGYRLSIDYHSSDVDHEEKTKNITAEEDEEESKKNNVEKVIMKYFPDAYVESETPKVYIIPNQKQHLNFKEFFEKVAEFGVYVGLEQARLEDVFVTLQEMEE